MDEKVKELHKEAEEKDLKGRISGLGQKIIGEIETFGGILTGDPTTAAEGELNFEIGDLREEIEETLEGARSPESEKEDEGASQ